MDIINFQSTEFQSAFQLAAALNVGLSVFRQMREPIELQLMPRIHESKINWDKFFACVQRDLREAEKLAAQQAQHRDSRNFDLELNRSYQSKPYLKLQEIFQSGIDISSSIDELDQQAKDASRNWRERDDSLRSLSHFCFFLSLFGLALTTFLPSFPLHFSFVDLCYRGFVFLVAVCYFPIIASYLLAFIARRKMQRSLLGALQEIEREIFRIMKSRNTPSTS